MRYTNINILDDNRRFRYIIEYQNNAENTNYDDLKYAIGIEEDSLRLDFFDTGNNVYASKEYVRNNNYWINSVVDLSSDYIPSKINLSSINLYFPTNSVESFTNNNLYALTINTWIHGHIIYLGTYIIDRRNAIAAHQERRFLNTRYFEYVNIKFIDPWYLTYSEDWKEFRQVVCGETDIDEHEQNNTGSVLNFTLYPVIWNEDRYIKLDPYIGGQNAINISDAVSDYIGSNITIDTSEDTYEKVVLASIHFNQDYTTDEIQTFDDLKQYMQETYDVNEDIHLRYNLMIVDNNNIYKIVTKTIDQLQCIFTRRDLAFENWSGWKDGLSFILEADIFTNTFGDFDNSDDEEDIMLLRSNTISITQDIMKYLILNFIDRFNIPRYINLALLDMNNYTVNAVNKIEKKIIQLEKPDDNKANLIKPIYYRVQESRRIVIHPAVTENICINLDSYKSTVSTFFIQIEGTTFVESARINTGVIFKIIGANLGNEVGEGIYYILNQDKEIVTSGKYKYES